MKRRAALSVRISCGSRPCLARRPSKAFFAPSRVAAHGPDAFSGAADAHALPEAHHRTNAFRLSGKSPSIILKQRLPRLIGAILTISSGLRSKSKTSLRPPSCSAAPCHARLRPPSCPAATGHLRSSSVPKGPSVVPSAAKLTVFAVEGPRTGPSKTVGEQYALCAPRALAVTDFPVTCNMLIIC